MWLIEEELDFGIERLGVRKVDLLPKEKHRKPDIMDTHEKLHERFEKTEELLHGLYEIFPVNEIGRSPK
jgi:predicted nuclease with TOPRIM domain